MIKKWSLIKDGAIVETITNGISGGKRNLIGGRSSANHTDRWLLDSGWIPHIIPTLTEFERVGEQVILSDMVTQTTTTMSQEEVDRVQAEKRERVSNSIYQIANSQTEQLRGNYSVTEAVRWTEDREAIALNNWSHFDARAGSTMDGRQYAETRVVPKIAAGNIFLDKVIAKRTDLMVALGNTLDEDLDSFDYTSTWDEETDYTPPPVEEVSTSGWTSLMDSIPFNIKLW